MLISRLLNEHAKLRLLGADLVALIATAEPCDLNQLASGRWNMARMVHLHLAYEERHLFCRLESDSRAEVRAARAKAQRGVEQLHISYKSHVERWTADEMVNQWPAFGAAVNLLVARMIAMINREEVDLFPLIADDGETHRSWRPGMKNWAGECFALQPLIGGPAPSAERASGQRLAKPLSAPRT